MGSLWLCRDINHSGERKAGVKLFSKTKYPSLERALVGYWLIKLNFSMLEPDSPSPARVGGNRSSLGTGAVKGNLRVYLAKELYLPCRECGLG